MLSDLAMQGVCSSSFQEVRQMLLMVLLPLLHQTVLRALYQAHN